MSQNMTMAQIQARFADEWILIGDPVTDNQLNVLSGDVLHHSRDRDEVYRMAVKLRSTRAAFYYTGTIPEGTEVAL